MLTSPLFRKPVASNAANMAITLLVLAGIVTSRIEQQALAQDKQRLLQIMQLVVARINALASDDVSAIGMESFFEKSRTIGDERWQLFDSTGAILSAHSDGQNVSLSPGDLPATSDPIDTIKEGRLSVIGKSSHLAPYYVRVSISLASVQAPAHALWSLTVATAVVLFLAGTAVNYGIISQFMKSIDAVVQVTQSMASGQVSAGARLSQFESETEAGRLTSALSRMSERLTRQIDELQAQRGDAFRSTEQMSTVLAAMVEGVIAIDSQQLVLLANNAAIRLLDLNPETVEGRPLWETLRHVPTQEIVSNVLRTGERQSLEMVVPRTQCAVQLVVSPLSKDPSHGAVLVLHDITDLRRLEGLRREFVANVSHELKTPLATISAYAETLLDSAGEDEGLRTKFLGHILEHVDRLHTLIVDLLSIAQLESQAPVFDISPIRINDLLRRSVENHQPIADAKSVKLVSTSPEQEVIVLADEDAIRSIFDNLLDNALNYSTAGGTVTVNVRVVDRIACEIDVADNGIGIAVEHQARIFERFYRVDKARSREVGGTGLGLSIVKHLCQSFGGTVRVQSRLGHGSTFTVKLPLVS